MKTVGITKAERGHDKWAYDHMDAGDCAELSKGNNSTLYIGHRDRLMNKRNSR